MKRFITHLAEAQLNEENCSCCNNKIDASGKCECGPDCEHCGGQHNVDEEVELDEGKSEERADQHEYESDEHRDNADDHAKAARIHKVKAESSKDSSVANKHKAAAAAHDKAREHALDAAHHHQAASDAHRDKESGRKKASKTADHHSSLHYDASEKADELSSKLAEAVINESIAKLSNARLKYHATKDFPHGSFTNAQVKDEHKRRMKTEPNYHAVKPSLSESVELDEVSNAVKDQLGNIDLSIRDWERRWKNKSAGNPNDMKAPQKIKDLKAQKAALMKKHGIKEEIEQLEELTTFEKKLINQMYDKKGNLTPIGKKVMDAGQKKESAEHLDELSPNTLSRYAKKADKQADKASDSYSKAAARRSDFASDTPAMAKNAKKFAKRDTGAALARKKLANQNESVDLDEVTVANSTAAFDLKKKAEAYKRIMAKSQQAKGQDAHDKFLKARTSFMNALKKLNQMDLPKAELDALRKGTNISESIEHLNESEINDMTAQYINENNITVDQLENMTEEELNELIGKAIGGAFKLGAKAAVGSARLAGKSARLAGKGVKKAVYNKQGNVRGTQAAKNDASQTQVEKLKQKRKEVVQQRLQQRKANQLKSSIDREKNKLAASKAKANK
ncbi:hypothetical protein OAD61_00265 [bacterium]|nr:hypothetical protein [bacterium]